ncbi:Hpt domain-containing protein [Rhodophyticola sp. CCM32]|uniref:Hpt domain-containing protein n=1 Tax=Rhodophyticola sp. CCM32 TaxID=2916397 RepID=UPI00107EEAF0|nr:Hpt domain-containing protein [Rhodophyticola sp. CCM32]QBY02103.1 Hpt domain-containing protein [Rhodophyticola sp. CCM32]
MIDLNRLADLRSEIGEEGFTEVADLFVEEMRGAMDHLIRNPLAVTQDDLHFLRGSAANLGLTGFVTCCATAEQRICASKPVDIPALVKTYEASLAAIASILSDRPETI